MKCLFDRLPTDISSLVYVDTLSIKSHTLSEVCACVQKKCLLRDRRKMLTISKGVLEYEPCAFGTFFLLLQLMKIYLYVAFYVTVEIEHCLKCPTKMSSPRQHYRTLHKLHNPCFKDNILIISVLDYVDGVCDTKIYQKRIDTHYYLKIFIAVRSSSILSFVHILTCKNYFMVRFHGLKSRRC